MPGRHPAGAPADLSVQTPGLQTDEWFKGSQAKGECVVTEASLLFKTFLFLATMWFTVKVSRLAQSL